MFDWINFPIIEVPNTQQGDTPPTFHATTECPNPWPGLILAFALGVIVARTWKR